MKKTAMFSKMTLLMAFTIFLASFSASAQEAKDTRLIDDAEKARSSFSAANKNLSELFDKAFGYAIFPNVGKGAAGIGAAAGSGIVYEKGTMIGSVKMKQLTAGLQVGGEAYREVIFFEDKETLERFKTNEFEFSKQTSATAMNTEDIDADYVNGVLVFTQKKTGLMYDASVGGQRFNYHSF